MEQAKLEALGSIEGRKIRILVWADHLELRERGLVPIHRKLQSGRGVIPFSEIDGAAANGSTLRIGMGAELLDIVMSQDDVVGIAAMIHRHQSGGREVPPSPSSRPFPLR